MQEKSNASDVYNLVRKNVNPAYRGLVKHLDRGLTTKHLYFNAFEMVLPHGRGAGASNAIILSILYAIEKDWELKKAALAKEKDVFKMLKNRPYWHTAKEQNRQIVGNAAVVVPDGYYPREMMKNFAWCMEKIGVAGSYDDSLPLRRFVHKESGAKIYFLEANKVIGHSERFKYLYCNDVDAFAGYKQYLNIMGYVFKMTKPEVNTFSFVEFNVPSSVLHWTYPVFTSRPNGVCFKKFLGSYLTMPKEWLGDAFFAQANMLKKENRQMYLNEFLGKPIRILNR